MRPLVFFLMTYACQAWAFPELIRFQYNNCTACHVAPSGGGTLTSYGRSLSSEVLSTWGSEKEAGFLHGILDREALEKWILPGGDIRAVQVHREDENSKSGRFIKMQADVSAAVVDDRWAVAATVGDLDVDTWNSYSTSYYGMLKPYDELSIRAGRFTPQYGLYIRDHIAFIRSFLGFGLDANRDVEEVQWTGLVWTTSLSYSKQFNIVYPESAYSFQSQYFFADSYKIALNYWKGRSELMERDVLGFWSLFGFTQKVFWLNEVDWQNKKVGDLITRSFVTYQKLGYTLVKGLDLLLLGEFQKGDLSDASTEINRYGLGFQFYPRPHFELSGAWTKQKTLALTTGREADYAWLLLHYYL